ncbi:DsbE family thiol:disulfide interchange protein [Aestuariirhabdus litorea]|uniref:DsbE family thiol:disulfide interchange protein n=1 Tax=Aestuariirhabdus litorea TaxID=2528527 RepID=A0A3P3VNY6_9GAMM|nr:DsbE family thiol:disulfide interchange protein [Aestuariirhabdus litorea]RRJ84415.1 DsbE family thiol:disulfide interchange protein [Aestuariirhabdus litorea]RWW97639.1 DsbE family thiol:disulfide interchange protein [Endozoicomonadaceae bacterium GTF-13]
MKRLKLFIPLIIFVVISGFLYKGLFLEKEILPSALIDKPFPEFSLPTVKDPSRRITRNDLLGEVSLVNVWATWCPSCRVEHPYLVKLAREEGIRIVGIDYKDERDQALRWLKELHDPYVFSIEDADGRLGIDLGVYGAPETYLVDAKGIIRYKHVGVVDEVLWNNTLKPLVEQFRREEG